MDRRKTFHSRFFLIAEDFFRKGKRGNIFNLALLKLGVRNDDARWALEYFGQSRKLGIITDGYLITQKNKVKALKIEDCFDVIVYSDEIGREHWKPSEKPYRKIMGKLSCAGNECIYIADNPKKDFITAKALGWMTVHIRRPSGEYRHHVPQDGYEADKEITSLFELKELIR